MKLALINDTHFGYKNDSPFFLDEALDFFKNQFFPYLKENNIKNVLHLGDLMDRRKYINFNTLNRVQNEFISFFYNNDINFHITIGNHDTYFKNTNKINCIKELFLKYDNIFLYEEPTELNFDGLKISIIPWITHDNANNCLDFIKNTSSSILAGHFEINGFEVITGIQHSSGLEHSSFSKFDKVLSGHFHLKQSKYNVHYLGTQYQMNFADVNVKKGFSVLDTATRELEFIENTKKIFHVIKYDDVNQFDKINPESIKNGFVKLIVLNKKKPKLFESFLDILYSCELNELTVVEEYERGDESENDVDITQDTLSIIANEIDGNSKIVNKQKIKDVIRDLYMESLSI